jgi:8-oxo-dGTP pyrophosphatase MutT (NUDIX family)
MDRSVLIHQLNQYRTSFSEEKKFVPRFLELLEHPRCFFRDHLPGHITGSSWIISLDHTKVLLVHHAKLNKWLQPGGHADGDEDVLQVAQREAEEETGLNVSTSESRIFDIDIHAIPARGEFRQHDHYDIRFLFMADEKEPLIISDESTDLKWVALVELEKYNSSASLIRMREKLLRSN